MLFSTIELVGRNEAGEESWAGCVRGSTGGSFGCTMTVGDAAAARLGPLGGGNGGAARASKRSESTHGCCCCRSDVSTGLI